MHFQIAFICAQFIIRQVVEHIQIIRRRPDMGLVPVKMLVVHKCDTIGIETRWTPHDLRRTAATGMGKLGVARFILSRVLNHVDGSVDGIYDRHDYMAQKREALELWAAELARIEGSLNNASTAG